LLFATSFSKRVDKIKFKNLKPNISQYEIIYQVEKDLNSADYNYIKIYIIFSFDTVIKFLSPLLLLLLLIFYCKSLKFVLYSSTRMT
jgi:lipopolysaccharide/colanic/teichoic acid biosynthesis glycosyltransferase